MEGYKVLAVPDSVPKVAMRSESTCLGFKWRIWEQKLIWVKRLQRLEESTLAARVYREEIKLGWPGLASEVKYICSEIGLPNINDNNISKEDIKEAIFFFNYRTMKYEMEKSFKCEEVKNEDFRNIQHYFNWTRQGWPSE